MRRRTIGRWMLALAATLALLARPAATHAGGVVVSLDTEVSTVETGKPFTVEFTIRSMHDGEELTDLTPLVIATNVATGERVKVRATRTQPSSQAGASQIACARCPGLQAPARKAPIGMYQATLTLPASGEWSWAVHPFGNEDDEYPPSVMTTITAMAPGVPSQAAAPQLAEAAIRPAGAALPWLLGGLAALLALAGTWLVLRRAPAPRA